MTDSQPGKRDVKTSYTWPAPALAEVTSFMGLRTVVRETEEDGGSREVRRLGFG